MPAALDGPGPTRLAFWAGSLLPAANGSAGASPLRFDPATGLLAIHADASGETVREGVSPGGFLEVTLAGRQHSSDPASAFFDAALAGAGAASLSAIRLEGSPTPLQLGSQTLAGDLSVRADGPVTVTGSVASAGPLALTAPALTVRGSLRGATVDLASPGLVNVAAKGSVAAGRIGVTAGVFIDAGQLRADGLHGGQIAVQAGNILQGGRLSAGGTAADGGTVQVHFSGSYLATAAAVTSADGVHGGQVTVDGGLTGRLFSSGTQEALGRSAVGGTVTLSGGDVTLVGATADASGPAGGGTVTIGSGLPAGAATVTAATLRGRVTVGSTTGTPAPASGLHWIDPHPTRAGAFGFTITPLSNGNLVVTNPHDNLVATDGGAVYLVQGRTGALLGSLVGSAAGERLGDPGGAGPLGPGPTGPVGDGVVPLTNGNYVVLRANGQNHWHHA
jgi:hypothetical protein